MSPLWGIRPWTRALIASVLSIIICFTLGWILLSFLKTFISPGRSDYTFLNNIANFLYNVIIFVCIIVANWWFFKDEEKSVTFPEAIGIGLVLGFTLWATLSIAFTIKLGFPISSDVWFVFRWSVPITILYSIYWYLSGKNS